MKKTIDAISNSSLKKFLVIFACAENSENHRAWMKLSLDEQQARLEKGHQAMEKWSEKYGSKVVFEGSDLGSITSMVSKNGIKDVGSSMGGFMIVEASSQQQASEMFLDHPHFAIFPGDTVDIIECVEKRV